LMVAVGFACAVVAGTITSCDDDNNGFAAPGGRGTAGDSGPTGVNVLRADVRLTGLQMVQPLTNPVGTATLTVTLDRATGNIMVTGKFSGLSSPATAAHIHGPSATDTVGPVLIPLTVTPDTNGT